MAKKLMIKIMESLGQKKIKYNYKFIIGIKKLKILQNYLKNKIIY